MGAIGDSALELVVVRSGQTVFAEALAAYLSRIEYGTDGHATLIHVPVYEHADVVADPTRAFGAPIFERGGVRVSDVLERFWAGESLDDLSEDFGVPLDQLGSPAARRASAPWTPDTRTSCVSHPDGLPDLFLDRSLGRRIVPELLRAEGLRLVTLSEHYGIPADEEIADEEWLEFAGTSRISTTRV